MKTIWAAAGQIQAFGLNQADDSLQAIERMIERAGREKVDLLVLPECAYPAYLIGSIERYREARKMTPDEYLGILSRLAREKSMHIVSGYVEDVGTHLHNSAILIDNQGQRVGNYRKSFLWSNDNEWFKPGEHIPVFDTAIGKIGMVICADTRAPEIIAKQVVDGAQVMAMPTCWINLAAHRGGFENPQPEYLISARAREFNIPFVCANKIGMESDRIGYCGRSVIADKKGELLSEAPGDQETLIIREIELRDIEKEPYQNEEWEELMQFTEAIRPCPKHQSPVLLAVWPGKAMAAEAFTRLKSQGVRLVVANGLADGPEFSSGMSDVLLPEHVGLTSDLAIGKVGCLHGDDFRRYPSSRLLALAGVEILCVFHAPDDLKMIRTRAIEDRVFILAVGPAMGAIVSPAGEVLAHTSKYTAEGLIAEVNLADAADKLVAPVTDIWEQRRVEVYREKGIG